MTVQLRREINFEIDRRFWALDHDQSLRVLRLYDEGRALMSSYLRKKREITTNTKILLGELLEDTNSEPIDRVSTLIPNEATSMSEGSTHAGLEMELKEIDRQLDDVATSCSEIQLCPALAQPIFSKLPRELRDYMYVIAFYHLGCIAVGCFLRIYDFLWSSDDIERVDKAMSSLPDMFGYRNEPAVHLPDLPVPIFANPRFVGTGFATEFAVRYVRNLTAAEIDYRCVRAHLNRDRFGPLQFPLQRFINRLDISLCDSRSGEIEFLAEMGWRDSLDSLLTLKDNRGVRTITIYLPTWMQYRARFFETLELTRPFFYKFQENSMDVKILGYNFFNPIEDDTEDIYSEQLNHYFDRTPEEWLDMKANEIKEIPDAKQRKACKGVRNRCSGGRKPS